MKKKSFNTHAEIKIILVRCNLLNDKDKQKLAVCGKLCFIEKRKVKNAKIQLILKNNKLAEKNAVFKTHNSAKE